MADDGDIPGGVGVVSMVTGGVVGLEVEWVGSSEFAS